MKNRYSGNCCACNKPVAPEAGILEYIYSIRYSHGRKGYYQIWCLDCFNKSDNSGPEDRICGDRAYEDRCAAACGFDNY